MDHERTVWLSNHGDVCIDEPEVLKPATSQPSQDISKTVEATSPDLMTMETTPHSGNKDEGNANPKTTNLGNTKGAEQGGKAPASEDEGQSTTAFVPLDLTIHKQLNSSRIVVDTIAVRLHFIRYSDMLK